VAGADCDPDNLADATKEVAMKTARILAGLSIPLLALGLSACGMNHGGGSASNGQSSRPAQPMGGNGGSGGSSGTGSMGSAPTQSGGGSTAGSSGRGSSTGPG